MRIGTIADSPWTRLALGVAAVLGVYAPIFPSLAEEWSSFPSLSHGFIVPFIAAYLVWARRADLARLSLAPARAGFPVVVGGLAMYVAGTLAGEPFVARISLLASLVGTILFLGGSTVARALLVPVGYLLFMIPLPWVTVKDLTDHLRIAEATATAWLLPTIGVPVLQEGFLLHLANMTLEVADVCSSVPAIMSLLALGAAFGYVTRRPRRIQLVLLLAAVPLGLASNILRITMTAAGVYYIGPIVLRSVFHTWHGAMVFLTTLVALGLLDSWLSRLAWLQPADA
jgi:exosortase